MVVIPAFGQPIAERTGLKEKFTIETGGYDFIVDVTANFDVLDLEISEKDKKLTLFISSSLENNLAEIQIPINLINGNFTFFLNEQEIFPKVLMNKRISFVTFEFEGSGKHKLEIIGTTYLPEFKDIAPIVLATSLIGLLLVKKLKKPSFIH